MRKFGLFVLFALMTVATAVSAAELGTQKNTVSGVTVEVTPKSLAVDGNTWDFKIVLDTHSVDLHDDLVKSALLLDNSRGKYTPVAWDGAGPGGHHREGVLKFKPVTPQPSAIELRITRPGEPKPRSFRWQLK